MKVCSRCKVEKSLDEFHRKSASKDGRRPECKECIKSISSKYYKDNKELIINRTRKYNKDNKEMVTKRCIQYRISHPEITRKCNQNARAVRKTWENPQPINNFWPGSHCHHLHIEDNHQVCIHVPVDLHTSVSHAWNKPETMIKINELVMEWYYEYGYKL